MTPSPGYRRRYTTTDPRRRLLSRLARQTTDLHRTAKELANDELAEAALKVARMAADVAVAGIQASQANVGASQANVGASQANVGARPPRRGAVAAARSARNIGR